MPHAPSSDTATMQRSRTSAQLVALAGTLAVVLLYGSSAASTEGEVGEADGRVPPNTTALASQLPAVDNLSVPLRRALHRATVAAAKDGVVLYITSGWRSRTYQQALLTAATDKYGSATAAARWVATPGSSPHVRGKAVDIGRQSAIQWLRTHGEAHGLCQVYVNEPWHFEHREHAAERGCPALYADPAQDPRMQTL